jgi:1-acyl-sn-glycerol-3-phosphate acyltransferase
MVMNQIRKVLLVAWLGSVTPLVVVVTVAASLLSNDASDVVVRWVVGWWSRGLLGISGASCVVEGLENIVGKGPYVLMSNHRSHMDAPVLLRHVPFRFGFIVKQELMSIPIFGRGMRSIGCVPVSRTKGKADHRALDGVAIKVAEGANILVFPEGTRSPSDDFLPFKKGGVILAINAGVPVLPVAISGTGRLLAPHERQVSPGPNLLRFGEPMSTEGLTLDDRKMMTERVRQAIEALYVPDYSGTS